MESDTMKIGIAYRQRADKRCRLSGRRRNMLVYMTVTADKPQFQVG